MTFKIDSNYTQKTNTSNQYQINQQKAHMQNVFASADTNGNGIVSKKELKEIFNLKGKDYKKFNTDKEKGLSYAEFETLVNTKNKELAEIDKKLKQKDLSETERAKLIATAQSLIQFENNYKSPPLKEVKYNPYEK